MLFRSANTVSEGFNLANQSTYINNRSSVKITAFRWSTVPIPSGADIDSASISLRFASTSFDDPQVTLYGEDVDNADSFTTSDTFSGLSLTTASVAWQEIGVGATWATSSDIATIISEITGRVGWASNNGVAIITREISSTKTGSVALWDYSSGAYAPKFNCSYTVPVTGLPIRLFMADFYRNAPGVEVF